MCWLSRYDTEEERAKRLERAVKEFAEFLRDHRSQDLISLDVQRIYKDVCSNCNEPEIGFNSEINGYDCANCGAIIEGEQHGLLHRKGKA
jgi:hypothetical protein